MSTNTAERLDADELLHLAIRASEADKHEESISFLKRAVDIAPKNGKIHYLLGAEHAQIGLYERAMEEMRHAVNLNPTLYTAHFQLGLLYVTSGQPDQAKAAWQALDSLGPNDPLFLFKSGLLHLVNDEFPQAIEYLKKGLTTNQANEALNRDMRRIIADIEKLMASPGQTTAQQSSPKAGDQHVLLSAYRQNRTDETD
jgi:tetratricopeptide (TPR) repeat protein